jgi:DNA-binding IclR family transcriptional regulator
LFNLTMKTPGCTCRATTRAWTRAPMPLTRGSASKAILSNLPARALRRFYEREQDASGAMGLGSD